jgi:excisionase family DNA binding protein
MTPTQTAPERMTVTVEEAAQLLGIGRQSAYQAARAGELPTIRLGRRLLVPLHRLHALLGIDPNENEAPIPDASFKKSTAVRCRHDEA